MPEKRKTTVELFTHIDDVLDNAVAKGDVIELVQEFGKHFKELRTAINDKMAENKDSIGISFDALRKEFKGIEDRIIADFRKNNSETGQNTSKSINYLLGEVNSLKKSLDEDSGAVVDEEGELFKAGLKDQVAWLIQNMEGVSALITAENIRNGLESLNGNDRMNASALIVEIAKNDIRSVDDVLRELLKAVKYLTGRSSGGSANAGGVVGGVSPRHYATTVTSATTSVTLPSGVGAQGTAIWVRYQGQMLDYGVDYTVSGNKITFVNFTFDDNTELSVTYWS